MMSGRRALAGALFVLLGPTKLAAQQPPAPPPDAAQLTLGFIDSAIADRRLRPATELIERAEARFAGPELELRKAELLLAIGSLPAADSAFRALEDKPALAARAKTGRAILLMRTGRFEEADALFAQALQLDPHQVRAWSARGVMADRRRDWPAAEGFYAKALATDPTSAIALNNRGYSRLLQGRQAEAEADFASALKQDSSMAAARTNLQLARALQGRYAESFTASNRKELARELNTAGVGAAMRGDYRIAQSYFSRAIEMNGNFDERAAANLAWLKLVAPELARDSKVGR